MIGGTVPEVEDLIKSGDLKARKVGPNWKIYRSSLDELLKE